MNVRVLIFGILADKLGRREATLTLDAGATVRHLLSRLERDYPDIAAMRGKLATAVNMEYVGPDHVLRDGDEVALIPPVSGG